MAQLGWVAGSVTLFLFAVVTYYTSALLADCYRCDDAVTGKRNYTYMEAVESYLGSRQVWFCGLCQYVNLVGTAIGYTITASISAAALYKADCFHKNGHSADCGVYTTMYMAVFGISQVVFSQLPNLHEIAWLSILAAVMSFSYSAIGVGLALAQTISGPTGKTTMGGTEIGVDVTNSAQKIWLTLQALGNIAFAYSYSMLYCQPIYAAVEKWAAARWPGSDFVVRQYHPFAGGNFSVSMFKLVWRTAFVAVSTVLAILMPFFNAILGLLGALAFWPLTVYFPVEMYKRQSKVERFSKKWVVLQSLSFTCFAVTVAVTVASVQGITQSLNNYVPFKTKL
ncbi:unnamed protein product [Triticum turgidum subsp. durum]|uniref:Amino acid transporter transmembrane domain-containing protein n=1 Tax=Triticum turgidum subsp. durum TaxID=4567 RepID=A0A9R1BXH3_TRITD|nr:unnamed protein product [Triticum turgidum subsp. durum]